MRQNFSPYGKKQKTFHGVNKMVFYTDFPKYPTSIFDDTDYPNQIDDVDTVYAALVNALKEEMQACFDELGVLPKGDSVSVAARFTAIEALSRGRVFSPISQWKMNDDAATTNVIDSVGTNTGTAQQNTEDITAAGKIDKALTFNGSSDYISIADTVIPTSGDFSISTWVYCSGELAGDTDKYGTVLGSVTWGGTNVLGLVLRLSGNNLSVLIGNNISYESLYLVTAIKTTNKEKWYHVVLSYDALTETLTGYTDGVLIGTRDSVGYVDAGLGALQIGHSALNSAQAYWYGLIDNTRIFDFALNESEARALYKLGTGTEEKNPLIV